MSSVVCGFSARAIAGASRPAVLPMSIRPGYTLRPLPAIVIAPAGTATLAPTALITPPLNTTVPLSIGAPETGTMRAPVMAYEYGASCWADGVLANTNDTKHTKIAFLKDKRRFVPFVFKDVARIT